MNRLLLGCILLSASWTVSAADTTQLYKVELIVFENLDPDAPQAENWPTDPGTPSLNNAMELDSLPVGPPPTAEPATDETQTSEEISPPGVASPSGDTPPSDAMTAIGESPAPDTASAPAAGGDTATPTPEPETSSWRWMAQSELSLDGDEQKLLNSGRYRPLLHIGWVQPLDSSDQGTPVHIYDGLKPVKDIPAAAVGEEQVVVNPLTVPPGEAPAPAELTPLQGGNEVPTPPEEMPLQGQPSHVLDGTFTLRQGRYLHVDVDLGYRLSYTPEPTPLNETTTDAAVAQPVTRYIRMTQSRRIRSDDLNYLDHPLFGVLFVVSPYQEPSADTEDAAKK